MKKTTVAAASIAIAMLAGCGETGNQPSSADAVVPSSESAKATSFGDRIDYKDDAGATLGSIVFREVAAIPQACVSEFDAETNGPGQLLGIKVELHAGTRDMVAPDSSTLRINDEGGFTQALDSGDHSCRDAYPEAVTALVGGKSQGWITVANRFPNPQAFVHEPLFLTLDNQGAFEVTQSTPASSTIAMPAVTVPTNTPVVTTTSAPPVAPSVEPEPEPVTPKVIVKCDYPIYENTLYSDGTRGQTDYCASQLQASADAESAANTATCDGTICTYPNGATRPDENAPKTPSPWVQSQIDWWACKDAGNTDEYCRANT
ncbi:hypothetical protein FFI94_022320 [Rhodococcus sp. KBS0724]|uniref:hypothetical protein n=1 Tax=Rhodococcus sp. KBS0724 TaxID=1179674 RepID=UPI00110EB48F|nr:hypothetical protein [Rhodococcus sp. KBS0724]TSD48601.1 hypothetical protein FFI94_022320 [Rhodococcus sp. KBS0724]